MNSLDKFDEGFRKILQEGNRKLCTEYRGVIIDEIRRRSKENEELISVKKIMGNNYREVVTRRSIHIASMIINSIGLIASLNLIFDRFGQAHLGIRIFGIILGVLNAYLLVRNGVFTFLYSQIIRSAKDTMVLVTKEQPNISGLSPQFQPELLQTIYRDSEETLLLKKKQLDEFLGF